MTWKCVMLIVLAGCGAGDPAVGGDAVGGDGTARGDAAQRDDAANVRLDASGPIGTWVEITPPGLVEAIGVGLSPAAPNVIYVDSYATFPPEGASDVAGIYKSLDGGDTWTGPIGTTFLDFDGSPRGGGNPWREGVAWTIAVDPTDPDVVYTMCAFAGPQGPWKSIDGGTTWRSILSSEDASAMTADVYAIAIDPADRQHLLMTFHSGWAFGPHAGVAESRDGGATWIRHAAAGAWGAGHYAFFLGQDDDGAPSPDAWLLATQGDGFWRTLDAGASWTQVSAEFQMQHGAGGLYRASTGVLYAGAVSHLIRSADNGRTWTDAGAPSNADGYNAVIGDGTRMFVQSANTGTNTTGPLPYYTSLETDGASWEPYNAQTFGDGPGWMAVDRANRIVYSANWAHGLWRLRTGD